LSDGASVRLQHLPAGIHIAGSELFEDHAGNGTNVGGIDFDQVAGLASRMFPGLAQSGRTRPEGASRFPELRCVAVPQARTSRVRMCPTIETETANF